MLFLKGLGNYSVTLQRARQIDEEQRTLVNNSKIVLVGLKFLKNCFSSFRHTGERR
jgi:hypothetical protein